MEGGRERKWEGEEMRERGRDGGREEGVRKEREKMGG